MSQSRKLAVVPAPPPPGHLSDTPADFWTYVVTTFAMEPQHLHILALACDMLERGAQARAELIAHGRLTVTDQAGRLQPHPAIIIERNATTLFAKLVASLDMDQPRKW